MRGGGKNLRFSANVGIDALYMVRNTEIHALHTALGTVESK